MSEVPAGGTGAYVAVSGAIFAIGALGVLIRRSPLATLMSIEVMWSAANLALVAYARQWADMAGQIMAFAAITVAAAEVTIGLSLVVLIFRPRRRVDLDDARQLKG